MAGPASRQILIAGAGVAGLTAALAFAGRGHPVRLFERAGRLDEVGAGLQLSPNATGILDRLGVLERLLPACVRPEAVVLRDAASGRELSRVPLGRAGEQRWGAPYLVAHRADLQSVLASAVSRHADISFATGAEVTDAAVHARGVTASVTLEGRISEVSGALLVGADGVWSMLRNLTGPRPESRFSGHIAWRTTLRSQSPAARRLIEAGAADSVVAFLHPDFHLVSYPLRGGAALNLVAVTPGADPGAGWAARPDPHMLATALAKGAAPLSDLAEAAAPWTAWPIRTVDAGRAWTDSGGLALIGDAAHAMAPFAAQGAAMAIEDAETLAEAVTQGGATAETLGRWEKARKARVRRVARRGQINRLAWHADGTVRQARDLFLRMRSPDALARDLDWLYGWKAGA